MQKRVCAMTEVGTLRDDTASGIIRAVLVRRLVTTIVVGVVVVIVPVIVRVPVIVGARVIAIVGGRTVPVRRDHTVQPEVHVGRDLEPEDPQRRRPQGEHTAKMGASLHGRANGSEYSGGREAHPLVLGGTVHTSSQIDDPAAGGARTRRQAP